MQTNLFKITALAKEKHPHRYRLWWMFLFCCALVQNCVCAYSLLFSQTPFSEQNIRSAFATKYPSDTAKIQHLQKLAQDINAVNPDLTILLADSSLKMARKLGLRREIANAQRLIAFGEQRTGRMATAMRQYVEAFNTFQELRDTVGMAHCYNGLGIISFEQKKYDQALEYYAQANTWFSANNILDRQSATLSNMAYVLLKKGVLDSAENTLSRAMALDMRRAKDTLAFARMTFSEIALLRKNFIQAQYYGETALQLALNTKNKVVETRALNVLGLTALQQGQRAEGMRLLERGLQTAIQAHLAYRVWESYQLLSSTAFQKNDFQTAYQYLSQAEQIHDSLMREEQSLAQVILEVQHERQRREQETTLLEERNTRQVWGMYGLGIGVMIFLGFSAYLLLLSRRVIRINTALKAEKAKVEQQKNIVDEQAQEISLINQELERRNDELSSINGDLRQLNKALTEAEKNRLQMLGVVSHDLRSPLSSVLLVSEHLMQSGEVNESAQKLLLRQSETLHRLIQLTRDILDAAQQELGMMTIEPMRVNMLSIVRFVVDGFQETLLKKGQTISFMQHRDGLEKYWLWADERRIMQVVENLISNASKYAPLNSEILIRIAQKQDVMRLEIQDQGPGLSGEDKEKMFGYFQRLSAKPTAKESSSGVGLAIAKNIVKLHKGKIWCESELGKGATFIVELPVALPVAAPILRKN